MTDYTLPDLGYDYGALEPHISGQIMELHHNKHHQAYVTGANTALEQMAEARDKDSFGTVNQLSKNLAFNLAGHVNHTVFWQNLSPDGGDKPDSDLGAAVDEFFGSFDGFKSQLTEATTTVQGSGWGALMWDPLGQRLYTAQIHDHQDNIGQGSTPLLVIDIWEHAFYLQYKNVKADYVEAFWNIVNWNDVAKRLQKARKNSLV